MTNFMDSTITTSKLKENIVQQNLEDDLRTKKDDIISRCKTGSRDKSI